MASPKQFEKPILVKGRSNEEKFANAGGDGYNRGMETRIAKLESDVEYIKRDIGDIKTDIRESRADIKGAHSSITNFGICTLLAVVLCAVGIIATILARP